MHGVTLCRRYSEVALGRLLQAEALRARVVQEREYLGAMHLMLCPQPPVLARNRAVKVMIVHADVIVLEDVLETDARHLFSRVVLTGVAPGQIVRLTSRRPNSQSDRLRRVVLRIDRFGLEVYISDLARH